jgi:hypothetical protein
MLIAPKGGGIADLPQWHLYPYGNKYREEFLYIKKLTG